MQPFQSVRIAHPIYIGRYAGKTEYAVCAAASVVIDIAMWMNRYRYETPTSHGALG